VNTGISNPAYRRTTTSAWLQKSNAALFGKTIVPYITVKALIDASGFLLAAGGMLTTPKLNSLIVSASMFVQTGSCNLLAKFSKIVL
jgi:hypothetical protein